MLELFEIGSSTVCEIVHDTCQQIALPKIAEDDRLKELVEGFELTIGFPQAVDPINGTHVPIIQPEQSPADYYNQNECYSMVIQGVVDFQGNLWTHV